MSNTTIQKAATKAGMQAPLAVKSPANRMRHILDAGSVRELFESTLKEKAPRFISGIIDLYASDTYLQNCDPAKVAMECLKAATLDLPINKQLGFAWVVPYNNTPTFQLGYKGYIQLAQRTGAYRYINADIVYEGELAGSDKLTGAIDLSGTRISDEVTGYFAYIETLNGFSKALYMTVDEVRAWGKRYSKSYSSSNSAWTTNFDDMAIKTCLRRLISKWGIMSVEMVKAFELEDVTDLADRQITDGSLVEEEQPIEAAFVVVNSDTGEVVT